MNLLQIVNSTLTECKKGLIRLKNHPRVFIFGGMAVSTVGTVAACAATYKHIDRIMDTTKEKLDNAKNGKEKAAAVGYCAAEMGKAFAGPAALVIAGNAAIAYGNHLHEEKEGILSEALTTVGAAYTALKERMEEKLGASKKLVKMVKRRKRRLSRRSINLPVWRPRPMLSSLISRPGVMRTIRSII